MMITSQQKQLLSQVGNQHKLDLVILYGSTARQDSLSSHPDVDLALYRQGGVPSDEYLQLMAQIQAIFQGQEVDVKTLHDVTPLFRFEVMRHGQLLYGDSTLFQEFYLYSYRAYQDSQSLYQALDTLQQKRQHLLTQND